MPLSKAWQAVKRGWDQLQEALMWFGDRVSDVLFSIIYYTVFALIAIPYRVFGKKKTATTTSFREGVAFERASFEMEG